uniref:fasciclin domain-containing protein n=1 Tax=Parerythrobacter lutipelagi TaxID=1964208 RepID=UPI0010F8BA63|nr:fasciclin domain-containing protein [Parerythrobacter lutipelagi]
MKISHLIPAALAFAATTACTEQTVEADGTEINDSSLTELVRSSDDTAALASALDRTGLSAVFDGPGGYTILAPSNEALSPIAAGNPDDGQSALVAAILRDHIMPGQLDLAAIESAIESSGGSVSIATVGSGTLTFTREGGALSVKLNESDRSAKLTGAEKQGNNGGLLMIDRLLVVPPDE